MTTDTKTTPDDDAAALASLTPGELLQFRLAQRQLAALERQNEILGASHRQAENTDAPVAEKLRLADEARTAAVAATRSWRARCELAHELVNVQGSPVVVVGVVLVGHRVGDGPHRVQSIAHFDAAAAEAAIKEDIYRPHATAFAELERAADAPGIAAFKRALDGKGSEGLLGARTRTWREITKPVMQKLIRKDGSLEDLLARGAVQLVGAIEESETAPRTTVDA
jgi:hypothetical protein